MEIFSQKAFFQAGAMMHAAGSEKEVHGQYPITLVTAYFELGGRPYPPSGNPYPGRIRNFLPYIKWPLVIFCDQQSLDMLKEARGDKPAVYHVTRLEDFYAYRYLDDLKRLRFPAEHAEAFIGCSLVWHEKHHFLRQAMSENPFGSEMLFWCDIGVFRWDASAPWWSARRMRFRLLEDIEWPNLQVCREICPQDKVVLISYGNKPHFTAQFFGGAVAPARRWCDAYYRRLEWRKQNGGFTHVEEIVMLSCWRNIKPERRRQQLVYVIPGHSAPYIGLLKGGSRSRNTDYKWYFLNGRRFPWKYFCRRIFTGLAR